MPQTKGEKPDPVEEAFDEWWENYSPAKDEPWLTVAENAYRAGVEAGQRRERERAILIANQVARDAQEVENRERQYGAREIAAAIRGK